jgi:hypothetical protein
LVYFYRSGKLLSLVLTSQNLTSRSGPSIKRVLFSPRARLNEGPFKVISDGNPKVKASYQVLMRHPDWMAELNRHLFPILLSSTVELAVPPQPTMLV